ncbi:T6SS phospholipase effector Tle1-like catalytic domain-containing protein [Archangium gephyra]|uniref:T6SS phospholipase effector Tle1-like catalytic domain-containing protein n=1 Tax=Archangium gephyra TaxID=48 RepID=UPI003B7FB984
MNKSPGARMPIPTEQKTRALSNLGKSASLAYMRTDVTTPVPSAKGGVLQCPVNPEGLSVTFFFDGTGNNLDADLANGEHSNVARLYRAHREDPAQGIFRYYVPGIGTYFKDIGDPGDELRGNVAGGKGEARLQWAMQRMDECISRSKGRKIHLSLFGFSRGATLARAFALRIAQRCLRANDDSWLISLGQRAYPIRLYFMGLFDTVASVGVPMSANNTRSQVAGLFSTRFTMMDRSQTDLINLAFGNAPGADPAPGPADGHMDWAKDLHIPEMVEDCLHMMAAHEVRNSFPVDSVLQGVHYPTNCREMVYPGAHSDVGGGYRPGEGARSRTNGSLLSMIPLRAMREQALRAGVPLRTDLPNIKKDFAEDPGGKDAFELLCQRFTGYMSAAGSGGKPLGTMMLSHMALYFQWRFHRIARDRKDRKADRPTKDEALFREFQSGWKIEKAALAKETETQRRKFVEAVTHASRLKMSHGAKHKQMAIERAEDTEALMKNEYLSIKARLDTMPSSDGSFLDYLELYDEQLMADVQAVQYWVKKYGRQKLRPHYQMMLEAFEAEQRGMGLRDQGIIQFFDTYVHDSLAAFAMDATLPSDPRVIYIGADNKLPYAMNKLPGRGLPTSALG